MPRLTVFTPTYNRADLISRVFDSLNAQSYTDFEWIVIDDGSTDETLAVLDEFKARASYAITILSRENRGKVASINQALELAHGELFIVFDSDDWCTPDAFSRIVSNWDAISATERLGYSGLSCLKCYADGTIVGENYDRLASRGLSYIARYDRRVLGDKWEIIRTDVHREYRYDLANGERYMAPEYAWLGIGTRYLTAFINAPLSIVEYQAGGISANNLRHRMMSPISTGRFYERARQVSRTRIGRFRAAINQVRFYLHSGGRGSLTLTDPLVLASLPLGIFLYLRDQRVGR